MVIYLKTLKKFRHTMDSLSLKAQLIIFFVIMTFSILSLSFVTGYMNIMDIMQKRSEKAVIQQFQQAEYNILSFLSEVDKVSKLFLLDPKVQAFLESQKLSQVETIYNINDITSKLSEIKSNYDYIESIYLFSEKGEIFGLKSQFSNYYMQDDTKSHQIFASKMYVESKKRFPSMIWVGGILASDFENEVNHSLNENPVHIISAVRGVKSLYSSEQSGTEFININEKTLRQIYNKFPASPNSDTYILDETGKIISCNNDNDIGKVSSSFSMLKPDETYGSLVYEKDKLKKQLVYYRIGQTGWTLVSEIPLNEFSNDISSLRKIVFLMFSLSFIAILLITSIWIRRVLQPLNDLSKAMKAVSGGVLGKTVSKMPRNELGVVIRQFNNMSNSILKLVEENKSIEEEKRRLEIETLQAQINPHFLYNTLNTIKWMAMMLNAENIVGSLTALGNLLRPIFANRSINSTIAEEIEYVDNYVKIMNIRFGEGVKVTIDIPEVLRKCQILRFTLQPIVENAFSHGMKKQNYIGEIRIHGDDQGEQILLEVSDNGEGISEEMLDSIKETLQQVSTDLKKNSGSMSIGLSNVNRRIKLHFGNSYGISIESNINEGTKVSIKLPKVQKS